MDSAQLIRFLRTACPLGASLSVLITMVSCVIIVKANDIWVSGLTWPFLSDMGRDYPAYYVFGTGLTLAAILLVFTWTFNWRYHMAALPEDSHVYRVLSTISWVAGVLANPGLPVLAFFDTSKHSKLHAAGAEWFFYIETIAILLNVHHRELQAIQNADGITDGPRKRMLDHGSQDAEEEKDIEDPGHFLLVVLRSVSHLHAHRNFRGIPVAASLY
ncbi:uncharacterized protein PITG_17759 [Phytophthora infestans T30-4]|uniref:CWH43-like N-terminal domain-containing protein n=1 Tax=Phytophthora infestans (strain T30-4) TaxID=403677 RepID=D0NWD0_PHYIT|nr:uncharacterized protein PITG_17759 [Phytophthora infestans T30-4]EEY66981.1 conserved hypothetical protein [Phytophthora infestans T30-4]|eukprot:XP_002896611.1 conserved hypothetical protein [Phytophthora infestans T30-4]